MMVRPRLLLLPLLLLLDLQKDTQLAQQHR
jgi:hypothetical protein